MCEILSSCRATAEGLTASFMCFFADTSLVSICMEVCDIADNMGVTTTELSLKLIHTSLEAIIGTTFFLKDYNTNLYTVENNLNTYNNYVQLVSAQLLSPRQIQVT